MIIYLKAFGSLSGRAARSYQTIECPAANNIQNQKRQKASWRATEKDNWGAWEGY